jgi:hypothetical protein
MPLNPYSSRVRDAFLARLPLLAPFMTDTPEGILEIRIPHPRIPSGLIVSTDDDEVSIGFRTWHTHGDLFGGTTPEEHLRDAITFVEQILSNQAQIAISQVDGVFADAWVTDDPVKERRWVQPNEDLRIGTWAELAT